MVMGYICNEHGFQKECDVSEAGERICYECGNAMTGVTGDTRGRNAPPSDEPSYQQGDILWLVKSYSNSHKLYAFDYIDAIEKGIEKFNEPQELNRVYPAKREYRR